jgi:hypothetical protein
MKQYLDEVAPRLEDHNCYHRAYPVVIGISPPTYSQSELDELNANDAQTHIFEGREYNAYEASQMQRRFESAMRREKDRANAFKASGDKDGERLAKAKVTALNQKYAQFSSATGLSVKKPRTSVSGYTRGATEPPLFLRDIQVGRSLGAKAKNYDITAPDGRILHLTEGTRITNVEVIAGAGRKRTIDNVDQLVYNFGGDIDQWQKVKGVGFVDDDGESVKAELHWYQEPRVGKVEWKIKKQKGGKWYIDD